MINYRSLREDNTKPKSIGPVSTPENPKLRTSEQLLSSDVGMQHQTSTSSHAKTVNESTLATEEHMNQASNTVLVPSHMVEQIAEKVSAKVTNEVKNQVDTYWKQLSKPTKEKVDDSPQENGHSNRMLRRIPDHDDLRNRDHDLNYNTQQLQLAESNNQMLRALTQGVSQALPVGTGASCQGSRTFSCAISFFVLYHFYLLLYLKKGKK